MIDMFQITEAFDKSHRFHLFSCTHWDEILQGLKKAIAKQRCRKNQAEDYCCEDQKQEIFI